MASAVWSAEMALRISKKTTFEILMNHQKKGSLTPAVRGDYAKHNCPLDQYVRQGRVGTVLLW